MTSFERQDPVSDAVGEAPLPPAWTQMLIDRETDTARRNFTFNPAMICGAWGAAYLFGFGLRYFAGRPVPAWAASAALYSLLCGAAAVTTAYSIWFGRGLRGPAKTAGQRYGLAFALGSAALVAVNSRLAADGLPPPAVTLLWSASPLLLVGVLYMAGGALLHDPVQYRVGGWTLVLATACVFAGVPGGFLVLALGGGGGFLAQAGYYTLRARRGRAGAYR